MSPTNVFRPMLVTALLALLGSAATPAAAQAGDAAKGKMIFTRCAVCHAVEPGMKKLGPSLAGVFGRKAGTVPDFAYSAAMKKSAIVWNAKSIDAFLTKPSAVVPGSKMVFPGLANPADRANLIAYLNGATQRK